MKTRLLSLAALMVSASCLTIHSLYAACSGCSLDTANNLGIPAIDVGQASKNIIGTLSFVAAILSVFFIITAGIRYITSSGNKQRIEAAKQQLLYAVIGLIISVLAFSIVGFLVAKAP